jgi:hypothetical protein
MQRRPSMAIGVLGIAAVALVWLTVVSAYSLMAARTPPATSQATAAA